MLHDMAHSSATIEPDVSPSENRSPDLRLTFYSYRITIQLTPDRKSCGLDNGVYGADLATSVDHATYTTSITSSALNYQYV